MPLCLHQMVLIGRTYNSIVLNVLFLHFSLYLPDPWGSSNYRGMCIQNTAADFAGTTDSTAAVGGQLSPLVLVETDPPEITR